MSEPLVLSFKPFMNTGTMQNGKCLTARITESPRTEKGCSLSDILEDQVPDRYFLSQKALNGLTKGHSGGHHSSMTLICDSGLSRKKQLRSEIVPPLRANTGAGHNNLVVGVNNPSRGLEPRKDGLACTIKAGECGTKNMICIPVLTPDRENKRQAGRRFKDDGDPSFTVTAQDRHGIVTDNNIRRLTPTECERLQGFPDGWTEGISDTQRYKCLGNAVTVNVVEFIARHIISQET